MLHCNPFADQPVFITHASDSASKQEETRSEHSSPAAIGVKVSTEPPSEGLPLRGHYFCQPCLRGIRRLNASRSETSSGSYLSWIIFGCSSVARLTAPCASRPLTSTTPFSSATSLTVLIDRKSLRLNS